MLRRLNITNSHKILPENVTNIINRASFCSKKSKSSDDYEIPKPQHPFNRTINILGNDMKSLKNNVESFISRFNKTREIARRDVRASSKYHYEIFPEHCDIAIIGGGVIGSSIAYWLKQRVPHAITVTVVEKDPTVNQNVLSLGQVNNNSSLSMRSRVFDSQVWFVVIFNLHSL